MNHPKWIFKTFQGDVTLVRQDLVLNDNDITLQKKWKRVFLIYQQPYQCGIQIHHPFFKKTIYPLFWLKSISPWKMKLPQLTFQIYLKKLKYRSKEVRVEWIVKVFWSKNFHKVETLFSCKSYKSLIFITVNLIIKY